MRNYESCLWPAATAILVLVIAGCNLFGTSTPVEEPPVEPPTEKTGPDVTPPPETPGLLESAPDAPNSKVYMQAASRYLREEKYPQAVAILKKAVKLEPKNFEARYKLGEAYLLWCKAGRREARDEAVENLEKALELCNDENERKKIEARRQEALKL